MSALDLAAMRARALAATPGPWRAGAVEKRSVFAPYAGALEGPGGERNLLRLNPYFRVEADAAHIAGCDPQTILALLDRLEQAERERDEARAEVAVLRAIARERAA